MHRWPLMPTRCSPSSSSPRATGEAAMLTRTQLPPTSSKPGGGRAGQRERQDLRAGVASGHSARRSLRDSLPTLRVLTTNTYDNRVELHLRPVAHCSGQGLPPLCPFSPFAAPSLRMLPLGSCVSRPSQGSARTVLRAELGRRGGRVGR